MNNPSNFEFKQKFETIASEYDQISNRYAINRRIEALHITNAEVILEVGSATGIITESIKTKTVCTDISYQMCLQAKTKNDFVICCDAEMLPFREKTFDCLIAAEIIYYLQHPEKFIKYAKKILKNKGKLLISITNQEMAITDKIRSNLRKLGLQKMYFDDGVRKFMKLENLISILKKHGFQIESINKQVILPFQSMDKINRLLEKTPFNRLGIFIVVRAIAV